MLNINALIRPTLETPVLLGSFEQHQMANHLYREPPGFSAEHEHGNTEQKKRRRIFASSPRGHGVGIVAAVPGYGMESAGFGWRRY